MVNPVSNRTNDIALTTDDQFFSAKQDLDLARRKTAYFRPYDKPPPVSKTSIGGRHGADTGGRFAHWRQSEVDNHIELEA